MNRILIILTVILAVLSATLNMLPMVSFLFNICFSFLWLGLLVLTIIRNWGNKKSRFLLLLLPIGFSPIILALLFFINMLIHGFAP
jgi:hypothetical protein